MVAVRRAAGGVDAPYAARVAAAGLRAGLRGDRAARRPARGFDREAGRPGRRGHWRFPQRHARQRRGAYHRPGCPARGHARHRQGIADRFDHRQPDAGAGRGLPRRRSETSRPDLRHHRRAHPGRHAGARRHGNPGAVSVRGGRRRQDGRPVGDVQRRGVGDLLAVYLLSLVFTLGTHAKLFHGEEKASGESESHGELWPLGMTIGVMAVVTLLIVWMSEILVGTVEHASKALGLSNLFVGVVVVAVVGNAAEHSTAVLVAMRNRMELAIGIAIGSSTQIALFVAPLLVLLSLVMAPAPLSLAFSGVEVFLVLMATFVASILIVDGKSTWFTGVQLIAVYLVMAITVLAIPA